ncbi:MAG TPA: hypothetical protein PKO24_06015 [Methanomassiliicoccales archaeon]|nr:hypothetical protein [Methanomassiliicoccales archaeon]
MALGIGLGHRSQTRHPISAARGIGTAPLPIGLMLMMHHPLAKARREQLGNIPMRRAVKKMFQIPLLLNHVAGPSAPT